MVDVDALWKIVLVALAGGVGVTAVYGFGLVGHSRITGARAAGQRPAVADVALTAVAGGVCVAAVALGLYSLTRK